MSSNIPPSTTSSVIAVHASCDHVASKIPYSCPKPKRPLSGYNLFYRFKRNKVLEATAWMKRGAGSAATPEEEKRVIDGVLRAPPGLEGFPPGHAVWNLSPPIVNQMRASNIRREMEGKLFPNEDTKSRLHRKVHGMGFVEMGRVMREMWAGADGFTKGVFCELADVGRVRYRIMKRAEGSKLMATETASIVPGECGAVGPVSPLAAVDGQRVAIRVGIAPLCPAPGSRRGSVASQASTVRLDNKSEGPGTGLGQVEPLAAPRRVSTHDSQDANNSSEQSLNSPGIPLVTSAPSCAAGSTAFPAQRVPSSSAETASTGPAPSAAVLQLRNAIADLKKAILSDSIAITGLQKAVLFGRIAGIEPEPLAAHEEVSARDFEELSGGLGEALNDDGARGTNSCNNDKVDDCSSMIFGKFIHDVQTSNASMPDTNTLNNLGARMA